MDELIEIRPFSTLALIDFEQAFVSWTQKRGRVLHISGIKPGPGYQVVLRPAHASLTKARRQYLVVAASKPGSIHHPVQFVAEVPINSGETEFFVIGKTVSARVVVDQHSGTCSGSIISRPKIDRLSDATREQLLACVTATPSTREPLTFAAIGVAIILGIIGAAAGRAYNQLMDRLEPNRLQGFIRATIEDFAQRILQRIEDDTLREIAIRTEALQSHFSDYARDPSSPQSQDTLTRAEYDSVELIARIKLSDIGLKASHGAFMVVATLRLAMLQEQGKTVSSRLYLLEQTARDYADQAYSLTEDWINWHLDQFSEVYYDSGLQQFVFTEYGQLIIPADRLTPRDQVDNLRWDRIATGPERQRLDRDILNPTNDLIFSWLQIADYLKVSGVYPLQLHGGGPRSGQYAFPAFVDTTGGIDLRDATEKDAVIWRIEREDSWANDWWDDPVYSVRYDVSGPYKGWYLYMSDLTHPRSEHDWITSLWLVRRPEPFRCGWYFKPVWNGNYMIHNANWGPPGYWLFANPDTGHVAGFGPVGASSMNIWRTYWTDYIALSSLHCPQIHEPEEG